MEVLLDFIRFLIMGPGGAVEDQPPVSPDAKGILPWFDSNGY
jgi:hypothetical protein